MLAFRDLTEYESDSLWLPETGRCFLLSGMHVEGKVGHNNFEQDKDKSLDSLQL